MNFKRTLLVLRHAKSSWNNPAQTDYERPLNPRGLDAAPKIGRLIRERELIPQVIFSSTALRAKTTTELVVEAADLTTNIVWGDEFYHAPADVYCEALTQLPADISRAMVVGHNPGLESLVNRLTSQHVVMKTAALAVISSMVDSWQEFVAAEDSVLVDHFLPRELD